jgi:hypothetical protein
MLSLIGPMGGSSRTLGAPIRPGADYIRREGAAIGRMGANIGAAGAIRRKMVRDQRGVLAPSGDEGAPVGHSQASTREVLDARGQMLDAIVDLEATIEEMVTPTRPLKEAARIESQSPDEGESRSGVRGHRLDGMSHRPYESSHRLDADSHRPGIDPHRAGAALHRSAGRFQPKGGRSHVPGGSFKRQLNRACRPFVDIAHFPNSGRP